MSRLAFRLTYRAYLVLNKPLDELVGLLGFEIPSGPHVDLAGVKADGLVLHWKPTDDRKSTHRYDIQVNGTIVGEVSHADTSIVIANLRSEQLYIVRVITVNSVDFRAASDPIRVYTKPAASGDYYHAAPSNAHSDAPAGPPTVRPLLDSSIAPPTPPPMAREASTGGSMQLKRNITGRRPSPAVPGIDTQNVGFEDGHEYDTEESQHALTARLDEIGRETTDVDRQIQDEEQEAALAKAALAKERDELRADLKEKEDTSRDLRKQVNTLERNNQSAQNKKNAQEKIVQQKMSERQKLKDDAVRWETDCIDMQAETSRIHTHKASILAEADSEKAALQEKQTQEMNALKTIEDENREVGSQIKQLEREATNSPGNPEPNEYNDTLAAQEQEEDRYWNDRLRDMQDRYITASQALETARRLCIDATNSLTMTKQHHAEISQMASAIPMFEQPISRATSLRQDRRPLSGPPMNNQHNVPAFPITTGPPFNNNIMPSVSPTFANTTSPFFNFQNGMTLDRPTNGFHFSESEMDQLTGGAPMSPGAGADLLPADLLSNADEEMPRSYLGPPAQIRSREEGEGDSDGRQHSNQMLPGLGALPGLGVIPGLGASNTRDQSDGPISPGSARSGSPSFFASPGASASNLAFNSPDIQMDADRRSIRSNRSNRAASGSMMHSGSRFTHILGLDKLNRQRGKTVSEDGPALGSLTKSQSQSMPRPAEEQIEESEGSLGRRRNSSHAGNFFDGMLNRNSAKSKSSGAEALPTQKHIATRRRPFNMFGSKTDGWSAFLATENRPASPRPGSTHSTELPRPSGDSTNWGFWPSSMEPFGQRSSPLSTDWVAPQSTVGASSLPWGSRLPSRRPSIQHGPTSGVSDFILEDDSLDSDQDPGAYSVTLPPIGTRPIQMPTRPASPKLNPAAKDFKSLFSGKKSRKEDSDRKRDTSTTEDTTTPQATSSRDPLSYSSLDMRSPGGNAANDDDFSASPPLSRKSRDTHSITTADSSVHEYSTRNSLDRSVSYTPSELMTPSSLSASGSNKESFMAKLTRKSSSGKFSLPVFSREKKPRSARGGAGGLTVDEDGDEALANSFDSLTREDKKVSTRSWSAMFAGKMGKGRETRGETPSLSEASAASETGDEEVDEEGRL